MNTEDKVLAYLEGHLDQAELAEFEIELQNSPALQKELTQYKEIFGLESELAEVSADLGPDFAVKVMDRLEEGSSLSRFFERYLEMSRKFITPLAGVAVVALCLVLAKDVDYSTPTRTEQDTVKIEDTKVQEESKEAIVLQKKTSPTDSSTAKSDVGKDSVKVKNEPEARSLKAIKAKESKRTAINAAKAISPSSALVKKQSNQNQFQLADKSTRYGDIEPEMEIPAVTPAPSKPILKREAKKQTTSASSAGNLSRDQMAMPEGFSRKRRAASQVVPSLAEVASPNRQDSDSYYKGEKIIAPIPRHTPGRGETYAQYEESPRILVKEEPVSTFGLDVDNGSYTNARRFLRMGKLPPSDSVRIEEFVNYFDYDYPSQSERPFKVHYEVAPSPFNKGRHLLKLGVKAKDVAAKGDTPWNLVFLVDVSGSMGSANKLPLVKSSLKFLASKMRENDRIAIVTYANGSRLALDSTPASEQAKIIQSINSLSSGGGTNGSGGIQLAYEIAAKYRLENGVNRVMLATDGDFNVGISNFDGLMKLIEKKRKEGTTLTTLGYGSNNYQEKNLEQLANRGNGNYFYVDSFEEAQRIFGKKLGATLQMVAKDVKLQVEFNPNNVLEYRLVGYDNRRLRNQDFDNDKIDAGDIGSGHTVTAFYEVVLADSPLANSIKPKLRYKANQKDNGESAQKKSAKSHGKELAFVKIRYKAPKSDTSTLDSFSVEKSEVISSVEEASSDFRFAAAVVGFASILRESKFAEDYDLAEVEKLAKAAARSGSEQQEVLSLIGMAKGLKQ